MKKLAVFILIFGTALAAPAPGYTENEAYVSGEVLVKYRPAVRKAAYRHHRLVWGMRSVRRFKKIGAERIKLPKNMSVKDALRIYKSDPDVMYAVPNYYRQAAAVVPNDIYFNQLWGLNNTGQSVNGTDGTDDADMDAPEAWEVTTGSSSVTVAVIDTGIDYNHPDLAANIWINPGESGANSSNGIDDDGSGYIDDVRGWNFVDNDNDPLDFNGHGSHVAGIIAAAGNNAAGVTGVSWTAKIMPLKVLDALGIGTSSDIVSAIEYANDNGADVINLSLGSFGSSVFEKAAIDASAAVVVCAAGNNGFNNDVTPTYPASYESTNIIAVAATDQNDNLPYYSNFGTTSVDVAAPGSNIYSTEPGRQTVWSDNFSGNDISAWTTGGTPDTWGAESNSLTESPGANYQNNTNSWVQKTAALDLSTYKGVKLEFEFKGISIPNDVLYVETSTDAVNWTSHSILVNESVIRSSIFGDYSGDWNSGIADLKNYDGNSTVYIRFRFSSSATGTADGFYIDEVAVTAASSTYGTTEYRFLNGTSMATAFVSGLAALVKSWNPSLTNIQIKAQIENTVDLKSSLSNRVAAGGRVNAANALLMPPSAGNLSATAVSASRIDLSWIDNASNETGFEIERKRGSGGSYIQIATVASNVTAYSDKDVDAGVTFYYRVRAYNSYGKSGYSNEAAATISSGSGGGGGGGGCFISTAADGSSLERYVIILREFRDRFLLNNIAGRFLVACYYHCSPLIADLIAAHDSLRVPAHLMLLPFIGMIWMMLKTGLAYCFVLLSLFCFSFGILLSLRKTLAAVFENMRRKKF